MTEHFNEDREQQVKQTTERIAEDQEVNDLIGPAVQQTVSQYHSLLRQGLEEEVKRIIDEFEDATANIEKTIIQRVKDRLMDIVQEEVRRVFDDALSNAEGSMIDPTRGTAGVRSQFNESTHGSNGKSNDTNGTNNGNGYNGGSGGGNIHATPPSEPITPSPSYGISPINQITTDSEQNETDPITDQYEDDYSQQTENHGFTNWRIVEEVETPDIADDEWDDSALYDDEELYEGTVRVNVASNDSILGVVDFVRELRQKPQLRLLKLVSNKNKAEGVDIWLALREPMQLGRMLPEIQGVTLVSSPLGAAAQKSEKLLSVKLLSDTATPVERTEHHDDAIPIDSRIIA